MRHQSDAQGRRSGSERHRGCPGRVLWPAEHCRPECRGPLAGRGRRRPHRRRACRRRSHNGSEYDGSLGSGHQPDARRRNAGDDRNGSRTGRLVGSAEGWVPNVVGLAQAAAATAITDAGLIVGTVSTATSPVAAGVVLAQNPAAGANVLASSAVDVLVSSGPGSGPPLGTGAIGIDFVGKSAPIRSGGDRRSGPATELEQRRWS